MDVIFVRVLPLGIYIVVMVINHHGLGQKPPHPGGVVQQERHLGRGREPGVGGQSNKGGGGEGTGGGDKQRKIHSEKCTHWSWECCQGVQFHFEELELARMKASVLSILGGIFYRCVSCFGQGTR